jgi:hypothetical protein
MCAITVGVQEGNDDAVDVLGAKLRDHSGERFAVQLFGHLASRQLALLDAKDQVACDQLLRAGAEERIHLRHAQPGKFDHVLEAGCRDQGEPAALALDDGVDTDRRTVDEGDDLFRDNRMTLLQQVKPGKQFLAGRVWRGKDLDGLEAAGLGFQRAEIDEGAADVHADTPVHSAPVCDEVWVMSASGDRPSKMNSRQRNKPGLWIGCGPLQFEAFAGIAQIISQPVVISRERSARTCQ